MDTQQLVAAIETEIEKEGRLPEEKIFLKLLKVVWQVNWTVAPYDVYFHMLEWNVRYFLSFMEVDEKHEYKEEQLIEDWMALKVQLRNKSAESGWRERVTLINDVNNLRMGVRQNV